MKKRILLLSLLTLIISGCDEAYEYDDFEAEWSSESDMEAAVEEVEMVSEIEQLACLDCLEHDVEFYSVDTIENFTAQEIIGKPISHLMGNFNLCSNSIQRPKHYFNFFNRPLSNNQHEIEWRDKNGKLRYVSYLREKDGLIKFAKCFAVQEVKLSVDNRLQDKWKLYWDRSSIKYESNLDLVITNTKTQEKQVFDISNRNAITLKQNFIDNPDLDYTLRTDGEPYIITILNFHHSIDEYWAEN